MRHILSLMFVIVMTTVLTGCGEPYKCIDGKTYTQLVIGSSIYVPFGQNVPCMVIKP